MRYIPPNPADDWELFELVRRGRRPCSDAYADDANNEELHNVLSQLQLLRAAGCPADREKGQPNYQFVGKHSLESGRTVAVYVLKAKPSRWRLYYFVDDLERKRIVFLHAVSKKTDKRDPEDLKRCKRLLDKLDSGQYELVALDVPP